MGFYPMSVGKSHRLGQLLRGKIPRKGAHAKVGTCQVYRIRTVENRHFQPFHIPGRTE